MNMAINVFCMIVGVVTVLLGIGVYFGLLSKSDKLDATISLCETFKNIFEIIFPKSDDIRVMQASEMEYLVRTPCRTGLFWFGGKPYKGTLFNAVVPIGFVAQLPGKQCYRNGEVDLSNADSYAGYSFTDASQLCFVRKLEDPTGYQNAQNNQKDNTKSYAIIRLLQRAKRWQILVDKNEDVKTQGEEAPILAHIAVHTEIDLDDLDAESTLIAFTEHQQYMTFVRTFAVSVIRNLARRHNYEWFATNALEIVSCLNQEWERNIERLKRSNYYECQVVQWTKTRFSGVVIKTLTARENARLRGKVLGMLGQAEQDYENKENDFIQRIRAFERPASDSYSLLRDEIRKFCGVNMKEAEVEILGRKFKISVDNGVSTAATSTCAERIKTYFENQTNNIQEILTTNSDAVLEAVEPFGETLYKNYVKAHVDYIHHQIGKLCDAVGAVHKETLRAQGVVRSSEER